MVSCMKNEVLFVSDQNRSNGERSRSKYVIKPNFLLGTLENNAAELKISIDEFDEVVLVTTYILRFLCLLLLVEMFVGSG